VACHFDQETVFTIGCIAREPAVTSLSLDEAGFKDGRAAVDIREKAAAAAANK
jgi:hypothetical protein